MHVKNGSVVGSAAFLAVVLGTASVQGQPSGLSLEESAKLGRQYESAEALYQALEDDARGGQRLAWDDLPPWFGIYTRGRGGLNFDPDRPADALTTAKLTPEYQARFEETLRLREQGIEQRQVVNEPCSTR